MKLCIGKLLWESFKRRFSGDKYREESLGLLFSPNTRNSFSLLNTFSSRNKFRCFPLFGNKQVLTKRTSYQFRDPDHLHFYNGARSSSVFLHFFVRMFAAKSLVFCSFLCSRRLGSWRNISSSNITWRAARTAWKCLLRDGRLTKRITPLMW